jgi:hypothetical protein
MPKLHMTDVVASRLRFCGAYFDKSTPAFGVRVGTEAFQQSRRERKKVEMRFAHMKRILGLDRFRLRGLSGIRDEVLLTAAEAEPVLREKSVSSTDVQTSASD